MTVGAQNLQRFQPVVSRVTIDVVKLEADRLPPPLHEPAPLAAVPLQPDLDQSCLEMESVALLSDGQQLGERHSAGARNDVPAPHGGSPARPRASELLAALT